MDQKKIPDMFLLSHQNVNPDYAERCVGVIDLSGNSRGETTIVYVLAIPFIADAYYIILTTDPVNAGGYFSRTPNPYTGMYVAVRTRGAFHASDTFKLVEAELIRSGIAGRNAGGYLMSYSEVSAS